MKATPIVVIRSVLRKGFAEDVLMEEARLSFPSISGSTGSRRTDSQGQRKWRVKACLLIAALQFLGASVAFSILDVHVEEPIEVLYRNAVFGDPAAQFELAECYEAGRKVTKDPARALEWYRKAAAANYSRAQARLGERLYDGLGVTRNEKEAVRWLHEAARNGMLDAQMMMVDAYATGRGVEKNLATALIWDVLTRRTMELHFGIATGLPPKPAAIPADAAEPLGKDGKKEPSPADGPHPAADASGLRYIESGAGQLTAVYSDGGWETVYLIGITEEVTAAGRRSFHDTQGNSEVTEPDGTRTVEQDGTSSSGATVRIHDTFNVEGQRTSHRVISKDTTYEERANGMRTIEIRLQRDDGIAVILTEQVAEDGSQSKGQLRRADDGTGPKEDEVWTVRRILYPRGESPVEVVEKYSQTGLRSQQVARRVTETNPGATPVPNPLPGLSPNPLSQPALGPTTRRPPTTSSGYEDPRAFGFTTNIGPLLALLEKIESRAHDFAGVTEADYQRAQANAASYVIPLSMVPQNAAGIPPQVREQIVSGAMMHLPEFPLVPLPDDHSREVPFGARGAELIKDGTWKHAQTEHFFVHFRGNAEAGLTVQYVEGAYTVLMRLLNLDPQRGQSRSHIFVMPADEWKAYKAAQGLSPQLAGFAYKTELFLGASADGLARIETIQVLCHEITHAILARFYRDQNLPLWLNEGLAEYIGLRTIQAKGVLGAGSRYQKWSDKIMALLTRTPDPVMDVEKVFARVRYGDRTSPDRTVAFYANSQKCVRTLIEKLPVDRFATFFNALAAGNQPNVALTLAYGKQCGSVQDFTSLVNGS